MERDEPVVMHSVARKIALVPICLNTRRRGGAACTDATHVTKRPTGVHAGGAGSGHAAATAAMTRCLRTCGVPPSAQVAQGAGMDTRGALHNAPAPSHSAQRGSARCVVCIKLSCARLHRPLLNHRWQRPERAKHKCRFRYTLTPAPCCRQLSAEDRKLYDAAVSRVGDESVAVSVPDLGASGCAVELSWHHMATCTSAEGESYDKWLNDAVINAYVALLRVRVRKQARSHSEQPPMRAAIDSSIAPDKCDPQQPRCTRVLH